MALAVKGVAEWNEWTNHWAILGLLSGIPYKPDRCLLDDASKKT